MKFSEALLTIELVLKSKAVPLVVGESGIGKTSLVKKLSNIGGYNLITIDANLLKEGEIGGLPTVENYQVQRNKESITRKRTVYAVHTKLMEIDNIIEKNPDARVLLFIDEINRCEHSVQQELMNLILNREINGYYLQDNVQVIAAMNPSNKYESYENTEYQVVDMDPAQEDRFVWIEMDSHVKEWIQWGMKEEGNIHSHILEFISTFPQHLHNPDSRDSIKPTPRSWERISNSYKIYLEEKPKYDKKILYNVVKGNVGNGITQDFITFIDNYKSLSIKPEEVFNEEVITEDIRNRIDGSTQSKLYIIGKNCLRYISENENQEKNIDLFSSMLRSYPADLAVAIMREIKEDYSEELYEKFINSDEFIELFFSCYR